MSTFAELDANGYVVNTLAIDNDFDASYSDYINNACGIPGRFVPANPTSHNFATRGSRYYEEENAFLYDSPYPSWVIASNQQGAFFWAPPVPYPLDEDGKPIKGYFWDEGLLDFRLADEPDSELPAPE